MFYQCGTVFQTAFLTTCCNPETASRVTLASLGTVFQTALTVLSRLRLARHVQNLSRIESGCDGSVLFTDFFLSDLYAPVGRWDFPGLSLARYCLPDSSYCAPSPSARSPCSKSITDNTDATDFIFSRILYCLLNLNRIFLRLSARDSSSWGKSVKINAPDRRTQS